MTTRTVEVQARRLPRLERPECLVTVEHDDGRRHCLSNAIYEINGRKLCTNHAASAALGIILGEDV